MTAPSAAAACERGDLWTQLWPPRPPASRPAAVAKRTRSAAKRAGSAAVTERTSGSRTRARTRARASVAWGLPAFAGVYFMYDGWGGAPEEADFEAARTVKVGYAKNIHGRLDQYFLPTGGRSLPLAGALVYDSPKHAARRRRLQADMRRVERYAHTLLSGVLWDRLTEAAAERRSGDDATPYDYFTAQDGARRGNYHAVQRAERTHGHTLEWFRADARVLSLVFRLCRSLLARLSNGADRFFSIEAFGAPLPYERPSRADTRTIRATPKRWSVVDDEEEAVMRRCLDEHVRQVRRDHRSSRGDDAAEAEEAEVRKRLAFRQADL